MESLDWSCSFFIWQREQTEKVKRMQEENPLQGHQSLQKAVAAFKVRCRRVRIFCLEEGDEEQLATSYSQKNRLRTMGIANKHAAIKGMPVLKDEEAKMMTQAILAMRGVNQRRMKELHEEGNLKLQEKVLASKGTSTA